MKEKIFEGTVLNGFLMLFVGIAMTILSLVGIVYGVIVRKRGVA